MLELLTEPPPAEAIAKMTAIEGVRIVPTALTTQQGPDRQLGPEAAGAVLILQATFTNKQRAAGFWLKAAELFERLAVAPGFIRRPRVLFKRRRCASSIATAGSTATSPRSGR